jgi:hypothetical protein
VAVLEMSAMNTRIQRTWIGAAVRAELMDILAAYLAGVVRYFESANALRFLAQPELNGVL